MFMISLRYPPNVQWEVTSECNHDCIHCYNYWRKDEEKIAGMSKVNCEEKYQAIARKIIEQKPVSVVITGGEPFMVFERLKSSIDMLLKEGIFVSINTNAVLLNKNIIDYLKLRKIGLFVSFPCSDIDVCDKITGRKGSRNAIVEKLDLAYKEGLSFSFNIVVSRLNLTYVETTVKFLKQRYKIEKVSVTRVGKPINSDDSFNKYLLSKEDIQQLQSICVNLKHSLNISIETSCPYTACSIYSEEAFELFAYTKICTAGKTSYAIDTDGNVKACPRDSNLYGNILSQDFCEIWDSMGNWRDDTYIPSECKSCKALPKCLGGCRVDAVPFTGRLDKLDTISNLENIPIKFNKLETAKKDYYDCDRFAISDKLRVVSDRNAVRFSVGRKSLFLTKPFYNFLIENSEFSLKQLQDKMELSFTNANNVVRMLISNNIVNKI